jgi:hypothetical protein
MTIPYTFGNATTAIPLSQLDANFASPITLGNVAMTLSNTYSSIGNLTLANVTITSYASNPPISYGLFYKPTINQVAFTKTGSGTATLSQAIKVEINGSVYSYASGLSVTMPTLTAGANYAIYACTDGTIQASSNFTNPSGYTTSTSRQIGGFHYAPGSVATGFNAGANTTPQINQFSFYDLKFKPMASDPRGMTLVAGAFWSDIYLTNTNPAANGTSAYNVAQATGSAPPIITTFGSGTYSDYNWWTASEVAIAYGKRLPTNREFITLAYGTTEASSIGSAQTNTIWNASYVSIWGCNQVSGVLAQWGDDRGGAYNTGGWNPATGTSTSRGSEYNAPNAVFFGGSWSDGSNAGSRCSYWGLSPTDSGSHFGTRFVCDHLILV